MHRSEGARLLGQWLVASDTSAAALGDSVGVSRVTVHHWLHDRIRPRGTPAQTGPGGKPEKSMRDIVAAATGGAVPAEAWDTPRREDPNPTTTSTTPGSESATA